MFIQNENTRIMRISFWCKIFLCGIVFLTNSRLIHAAEATFTQQLVGPPIVANTVMPAVIDNNFSAGTTAGINYAWVRNNVIFEVIRDSTKKFPLAVFQMTARLEISLWYQGSNPVGAASAVFLEDLTLNCDSTSTNISDFRAFRKYNNALKMSIKVVSVTSPQALAYFPFYRIVGEIHTNKIYPFNCNTTVSSLSATYNAGKQKVFFNWASNSTNADDYDLEWNFYESESALGKKILAATATAADLKATFRFDATRVTVSNLSDSLATLYRNGYIIYRVRAARYKVAE